LKEQLYQDTKRQRFSRLSIHVFDGKDMYTSLPREANNSAVSPRGAADPDVMIYRLATSIRPLNGFVAHGLSPLLVAHGIIPKFLVLPHFADKLDPDDFFVHGQGIHAGRSCLVLRTFPVRSSAAVGAPVQSTFDEYWVDVQRDSAVLRQSAYTNTILRSDVDISYKETKAGWLPSHWTCTFRNPPNNQLIDVTKLRIAEYSIDPPKDAADFTIEITPGMNVRDSTFHESKTGVGFEHHRFHIEPNGRWSELTNGVEQRLAWSWRAWSGLLLTVSVALALALLVYRSTSRRRSTRHPAV
jgi:hypothetical protein